MTHTIERATTLVLIECSVCGIFIALGPNYERARRNDHGTFYCPSGHSQYFPALSQAEQLRRALHQSELEKTRLVQLVKDADAKRNRMALLRDDAERETARIKKRVAAGVCPCCHRTFAQSALARHMKTKHPDQIA